MMNANKINEIAQEHYQIGVQQGKLDALKSINDWLSSLDGFLLIKTEIRAKILIEIKQLRKEVEGKSLNQGEVK